ncbi:mucin-5AC-like [Mizuhopecten yessoensis]|uniref:mucin-5AC-like n=1 Tax=Mizuhopecten yessoensis TaxID=6573 RepID=UPI000B45BC93|nr:mucin-5AC-like [Mizuhopecten yessoensis]
MSVITADPNSVIAEPCYSSAPLVATTTVAPEATTTVAPEATTTVASEAITTIAPGVATASLTSSATTIQLETSSVTILGTQQTSSTATPQLSNTITTVDLTTAALSTESLTNVYTGTPTSSCYHCFCNSNKMTSMSPEELQSQIETLKKELTVEKKDLSSWKRKLISIPDERVSAKGLGYLGAGMLAVVFGAVVIIDLPRFLNGLKIFYHTMCSHKKVSDVE